MNININDKAYPIYLGFDAINYLDREYYADINGARLGFGIQLVLTQLQARSVLAIYNMIKAGTNTLPLKPSNADIEYFVGSLEADDFDKLCEEFIEELKKQPLTRTTVAKIYARVEKPEEVEA